MRKTLLITFAATAMLAASLPAAAGGGHGYRGYGGYGHSHARVGIYIGGPLVVGGWWASRPYYAPYYAYPAYPSYPYYPPVVVRERVVVQEPLVFYDENGNPVPATGQVQPQVQAQAPAQPQLPQQSPSSAAPAPTWYFCADTQKYYPYVQTCASPWQRVAPQAPPQ